MHLYLFIYDTLYLYVCMLAYVYVRAYVCVSQIERESLLAFTRTVPSHQGKKKEITRVTAATEEENWWRHLLHAAAVEGDN